MNKEQKDNLKWLIEILSSARRMLVAERDRADHAHAHSIRAIIAQVDAARLIVDEVVS